MRSRTLPTFLAALAVCCGTPHAAVVINEIMYNSPGTPDIEYIELYNTGLDAVDLTGWHLLDGNDAHTPCPLEWVLQPGAYLVVAGRLELFQPVYPAVTALNPYGCDGGTTGFSWGNSGDSVRLFQGSANLVDRVDYDDAAPWPFGTDGDGSSLELVNPGLDNSLPENWLASVVALGTPGAANSVLREDLPPSIGDVRRHPALPGSRDAVEVTAMVTAGVGNVLGAVTLWVDDGAGFASRPMLDDGLQGDGAANDAVFGARIAPAPTGAVVRYYVAAVDESGQESRLPTAAPTDYFAYRVGYVPPAVRITEVMASNQSTILDGAGEAEDWVEVANPGPDPLQLAGMFLTDDRQAPSKWPMPEVLLEPGEHVLFWADGEPLEGPFHTSFTLGAEDGEILLFDAVDNGNTAMAGYTYGPQNQDIAFGYLPEQSDAPEYLSAATPGLSNETSAPLSAVCINEIFTASNAGVPDWVELYNRGLESVDIGGWYLSDSTNQPTKFAVPPGTVLAPGEAVSYDETQLGFGLSSSGSDLVVLTDASGTGSRDYFDFGPQSADISQGRYPDGTPNWHFMQAWTRGAPNQCTTGAPPPPPVGGLQFTALDALVWVATDTGDSYDVVRGDLTQLKQTGGNFAVATKTCLENNSADVRSWEPPPSPLERVPRVQYYLVRAVDRACGFGTYDSGTGAPSSSRDAGIVASPASCP